MSLFYVCILAAGESKRMGMDKFSLKIDDKTFIEIIVEKISFLSVDKILILLSKRLDENLKIKLLNISSNISFLKNPEPEKGQLSSLKIAIENLIEGTSCIMMCPVDHPLVEFSTYKKLKETHFENPDKIIIPKCNGKRGHPVIFPQNIFQDIINSPSSRTTRDIIYKNKNLTLEVEVEDRGINLNINTPQDYEKFKQKI